MRLFIAGDDNANVYYWKGFIKFLNINFLRSRTVRAKMWRCPQRPQLNGLQDGSG